jgi:hypothetical protein
MLRIKRIKYLCAVLFLGFSGAFAIILTDSASLLGLVSGAPSVASAYCVVDPYIV